MSYAVDSYQIVQKGLYGDTIVLRWRLFATMCRVGAGVKYTFVFFGNRTDLLMWNWGQGYTVLYCTTTTDQGRREAEEKLFKGISVSLTQKQPCNVFYEKTPLQVYPYFYF